LLTLQTRAAESTPRAALTPKSEKAPFLWSPCN